MLSRRDSSTLGTVVGIVVMVTAIVGTTFLDWTWENPEGNPLPLVVGVAAAAVAVFVVVRKIRG